jgi:phage terminase small subunit
MKERQITPQQKAFADYFIELGNMEQAAIKAGYSPRYARGNAHKLVAISCIKTYLDKREKEIEDKRIAKSEEVLKYFTSVMRGEIKDQFDLDAPLQERTRAAEALAKRYRLYDSKDNKTLSEYEKIQQDLELEKLKLQNEKLRAEITKVTGQGDEETADDGFIKALDGKIGEVWEDEAEGNRV